MSELTKRLYYRKNNVAYAIKRYSTLTEMAGKPYICTKASDGVGYSSLATTGNYLSNLKIRGGGGVVYSAETETAANVFYGGEDYYITPPSDTLLITLSRKPLYPAYDNEEIILWTAWFQFQIYEDGSYWSGEVVGYSPGGTEGTPQLSVVDDDTLKWKLEFGNFEYADELGIFMTYTKSGLSEYMPSDFFVKIEPYP